MGEMGERIKKAREAKYPKATGGQKKLAEVLGKSTISVSRWERGVSVPEPKDWERLATALGVSVSYLIDGGSNETVQKKDRDLEQELFMGGEVKRVEDENVIWLPVYSGIAEICAGEGNGLSEDIKPSDFYPVPRDKADGPLSPKSPYIAKVEGDSMEPKIKHGDYVYVNPNLEARNGDWVVACWKDRWALKQLFFNSDGSAILKSLNEQYKDILVTADD